MLKNASKLTMLSYHHEIDTPHGMELNTDVTEKTVIYPVNDPNLNRRYSQTEGLFGNLVGIGISIDIFYFP